MAGMRVVIRNTSRLPQEWFDLLVESVFLEIVKRTPVDTGRCQDSWELNPLNNDVYEIVNPVEYTSYLENGWSKQAPDGMVGPTLKKVPSMIYRIVRNI